MGKIKIKKGKPDMTLIGILIIMIAFGLIMVFSASTPSAFYQHGNKFYFIKKQAMWTGIGFIAMFIAAKTPYHYIKRWAFVFYVVTALLMVLVPAIGLEINGAKRWLGIGSFSFQPSEIAKFALIFYFAKRLSEQGRNHLDDFVHGFMPYMAFLGVILLTLYMQHHLSAIIVISITLAAVLFVGGADWKHFIPIAIVGVFAIFLLATKEGYRSDRLTAYVDPFADLSGGGWQIVQGLYAIGSGGIFGRGLGQARQKFLYVPEAHNDYIYAILCEELGLIGAICVAVLFAALITRCIIIAINAPDTFSKMSVFGITTLIAFQYAINIGVVTAAIPNTGMQLPFFSAGGSSLVFLMAAMGVVINISTYSNLPERKEKLK